MFQKLTQLGYSHAKSEGGKRAFYFSNLINLSIFGIFFLILLADIVNLLMGVGGNINYFITNLALESICFINLFLNSKGLLKVSRASILVALFVLIYIFTPLLNNTRNEAYFWYPYIPIGSSLVLYFLFLRESDRKYLKMGIVLNFIMVLLSDVILNLMVHEQLAIKAIISEDYLSYKINPAMMFIFVNLTIYNALMQAKEYEMELTKTRDSLSYQNRALVSSSADKDKFYSVIAHDLRGPFSSISTLIQMLEKDYDTLTDTEKKKYLELLSGSSKETFQLLENLLRWSKSKQGTMAFQPEMVDLQPLVHEVISALQVMLEDKKISIRSNIEPIEKVFLDLNMMRTIIRNLTSNAIKFVHEGGNIKINVFSTKNELYIEIADDGVGMPNETVQNLFNADSRTSTPGTNNEQGTGLGLLIVKEFVDKHDGNIDVKSEENKGTLFRVSFPMIRS